jgi:pyroglutamyl-peptidase
LLVTGFGPFPGVPHNPTEALVASLDGRRAGRLRVDGRVLDVSFAGGASRLSALLAGRPEAVLMFGVARGAGEVRVEAQAVNRAQADLPDVEGRVAGGGPVDAALAVDHVLRSAVDVDALAAMLQASGVPARVSDDAGRYVCNAMYLHALAWAATSDPPVPCVFVHVPPLSAEGASPERLEAAARRCVDWLAERPRAPRGPHTRR